MKRSIQQGICYSFIVLILVLALPVVLKENFITTGGAIATAAVASKARNTAQNSSESGKMNILFMLIAFMIIGMIIFYLTSG